MFERFPSRIDVAKPFHKEFPFFVITAVVNYLLNKVFSFHVIFVSVVGFNWRRLGVNADLRRERVILGAADKIDMKNWVNSLWRVELYCVRADKFKHTVW